MSDKSKDSPVEVPQVGLGRFKKWAYLGENQLHPAVMGVCANLVVFPWVSSPTRIYMVGNMIPKAVVTSGASERKLKTGNEYQYAKQARCIQAPSNMTVEEIFYAQSVNGGEGDTDKWAPVYVVFRNEEKGKYDIMEFPRYNVQNSYVGFEYVYDMNVMRKLRKGAVFPKGTIFAKSPRISKDGEWMFGMDLKVAPASFHYTEEDGIGITESCAATKLRCMFEHMRSHGWNEDEWVPLTLYGDSPFPQSGERIREDGIVMGFRRRVSANALVSLTKKALTIPDETHDILFRAPVDSEVMSVEVISERMKNKSNNRSTEYIKQAHTNMLERYERRQNDMWNEVIRWHSGRVAANRGNKIAMTRPLNRFIRFAKGNYTINANTGKPNPLFRAVKRVRVKDWSVTIRLREIVSGRAKFKMSGMNGDKGVIVRIIPDADAPRYDDGTVCDVVVNNTPAFRRQIFSMLMEQSINFINVNIHKEVVQLHKEGDYVGAMEKLMLFYETGFPEFAELVQQTMVTREDIIEYVNEVAATQISVHVRSDTKLYGVEIIKALRKVYSYKPQHITFRDSLGEMVRSVNPVLITNQHFMLLDKFGTDMSAQSLPMSNPFGMPAKLNEANKYSSWLRMVWNRNKGETEGRLTLSQVGAKETVKQLAMGYAPELRTRMAQRIVRAEDGFNINQIIKPEEYGLNRAVQMSRSMLSDSGYTLRRELPSDRSDYEAPDALIPRARLDEPLPGNRTVNPAGLRADDEFEKDFLHKETL